MILKEIDNETFDEYSNRNKYSNFIQSSFNKVSTENQNMETYLLGLYDDDKLVGATYVTSRYTLRFFKYLYMPRGFLLDNYNKELVEHMSRCLKEFANNKNAIFYRIDPLMVYKEYKDNDVIINDDVKDIYELLCNSNYKHNGFKVGYHDEQPRYQYVLDIKDKEYKDVFKRFKQNTRNKVNAAIRFKTSVRIGSEKDIKEFFDILEETSNRQNFNNRTYNYYLQVYKEYSKQNKIRLLFADVDLKGYNDYLLNEITKYKDKIVKMKARNNINENSLKELENNLESLHKHLKENEIYMHKYNDKVVSATSMFVIHKNEVCYFHSGGYDDVMALSGQYLLQAYMIEYACNNKIDKYNFMGISGEENDGVYIFKKGFNGYMEELIGQFDYICSSKYNLYKIMYKLKEILR